MQGKANTVDDMPTREFHPIEGDDEWQEQGWSTEPLPLTVASGVGAVISIRLDPESLRRIDDAAKAAGLSWAEFVKRAALSAATAPDQEKSSPQDSGRRLHLLKGTPDEPHETDADDHDDEGRPRPKRQVGPTRRPHGR